MLHSICQQIWKTHQWPQDWKRSVFILIPNKGNAKECKYTGLYQNCNLFCFKEHHQESRGKSEKMTHVCRNMHKFIPSKWIYSYLRDIVGSVLDHHNEVTVTIKWVTWTYWFSSAYKFSLHYTIDVEIEAPILWPPNAKSQFIGKDPDAGKDWKREEKGTAEDEMVGWHHRLDGHESEHALGVDEGQGSLVCCSSWGCKESDTTERLKKY